MTLTNNLTTTKKHTNNKKTLDLGSIFLSIMIIVLMVLILFDSVTYSKSIIKGLSLYFTNVLPGLLPFVFLVKQLTNQNVIIYLTKPFKKLSNKLFGVSEYGLYAFLMSIISGYPIGSKITSDLYINGKITDKELTKIAILSSTPGLIFVIGSVGGLMLKSVKLGLYIYLINILSVIIASFLINIFSLLKEKKKGSNNLPNKNSLNHDSHDREKQSLGLITKDTTISLLSVGFYIALFSLIIDLLTNLNIFSFIPHLLGLSLEKTATFNGVMSGIVEMTNGAKLLSKAHSPLSLAFISSIISFSGISIIMQSLSFLSLTPLKKHLFILGKLLQMIICFVLSLLFFVIIL